MERIILKSIDFLQESTIIEVLSLYSKVHFQTSKYFSMTQNSRSKFNFPIITYIELRESAEPRELFPKTP